MPDFQGESNPSQAERSEAKRSRYLSGALARPHCLPDFQGESNPSQAEQSEAKWSRYLSGALARSSGACQIKRRLPDQASLAIPRRLLDFQGKSNPSQAERSEAKRSQYLSGALARSCHLPDFRGKSNPSQAERSKAKLSRYLSGVSDRSSRSLRISACQTSSLTRLSG